MSEGEKGEISENNDERLKIEIHNFVVRDDLVGFVECLKKVESDHNVFINNSAIIHTLVVHDCADLMSLMTETEGVNLNIPNHAGASPLCWAAIKGREEIVKILVNAGAKLESTIMSKNDLVNTLYSWTKDEKDEGKFFTRLDILEMLMPQIFEDNLWQALMVRCINEEEIEIFNLIYDEHKNQRGIAPFTICNELIKRGIYDNSFENLVFAANAGNDRAKTMLIGTKILNPDMFESCTSKFKLKEDLSISHLKSVMGNITMPDTNLGIKYATDNQNIQAAIILIILSWQYPDITISQGITNSKASNAYFWSNVEQRLLSLVEKDLQMFTALMKQSGNYDSLVRTINGALYGADHQKLLLEIVKGVSLELSVFLGNIPNLYIGNMLCPAASLSRMMIERYGLPETRNSEELESAFFLNEVIFKLDLHKLMENRCVETVATLVMLASKHPEIEQELDFLEFSRVNPKFLLNVTNVLENIVVNNPVMIKNLLHNRGNYSSFRVAAREVIGGYRDSAVCEFQIVEGFSVEIQVARTEWFRIKVGNVQLPESELKEIMQYQAGLEGILRENAVTPKISNKEKELQSFAQQITLHGHDIGEGNSL